MSATAQQTPAQELVDRALEHAPARGIPFLIALQNMQHMFGLKHKKDREDYEFEKQQRGAMSGQEVPSSEPEDMGNITVAGDTTTTNVHHHYHTPPTETKSMLSGFAKKLLPVAVGAALPVGGFLLAQYFNRDKPEPAPVVDTDTDTNTQYVIEALPGE